MLLSWGAAHAKDQRSFTQEQLDFFEKKIRPVLYDNCYNCHSADNKEAGGLRVDDWNAIQKGGNNGPGVVPGDVAASVLISRIRHADDKRTMPPDYRLEESQIQDIEKWIADGAAWPQIEIPSDLDQSLDRTTISEEDIENHWSWQPLREASPPNFPSDSVWERWARTPVDRYIAKGLQEAGLSPSRDATKVELVRRLYYDLTGLPPTESQLIDFLFDPSDAALEKLVDRLLESPAFGERWGRHWLDVARYGESTGSARNLPYPHAWRYRDYVIESLNADKPFDQFIKEQVAGDLLPANSPSQKREQLVATGFLALGVKDVNQRFKVRYDMDNVDEQIDTVTRSVLALTVSCARCHDHKFDPISTRDYYGIAGIFTSTELCDGLRNQMGGGGMAYYVPDRLVLLSDGQSPIQDESYQKELTEKQAVAQKLRQEFIAIRDSVQQEERGPEHTKKLQAARQAMLRAQEDVVALQDPAKAGPVALGVRDAKEIGDTQIRLRGEAEKLGPSVPRGFLSALRNVPVSPIPDDQSGRLELARWLVHKNNALSQRVIVNRIWKHLFSEGIVSTVDNFGITGDAPSHPELLDYLASDFVQNGWSIKKLVKKLVLSRSYQLSTEKLDEAYAKDPANRLVWRHSPRRLDAEEIRDSILASSGRLNLSKPDKVASHELLVRELRNNGPEAKAILEDAAQSTHRSLYLSLLRTLVPSSLEAFDYVEQGMVTGKRDTTTVPTQSLFLLNSGFIRENAAHLASKLYTDSNGDASEIVRVAYRRVLQRVPTSKELEIGVTFLKEYREVADSLAGIQRNASESSESPAGPRLITTQGRAKEKKKVSIEEVLANAAAPEDSREDAEEVEGDFDEDQLTSHEERAVASYIQALYGTAEFRYVR